MIVIFDFDRTLFNNKKFFEEDMPDLIGVERQKFLKVYNENFKDSKTQEVDYELKEHLQALGLDDELTMGKIEKLLKSADRYLNPGALELLEGFKRNGDELYLATFGNISWQKEKIDHLKQIEKYFDDKHKIITDKSKQERLEFLENEKDEIIIINDKPEESIKMENAIGKKCKIFIMASEYSESSDYKGKIYKSLEEIKKEIFPDNSELTREYKARNR